MEIDKENNKRDKLEINDLGNSLVIVDPEELTDVVVSGSGDGSLKRKRNYDSPVSDGSSSSFLDSSLEHERGLSDMDDSKISNVTAYESMSIEEFDKNLPETVTLLKTDWGSKVYLVGTAHFSEESQEDVSTVIRKVEPNYVVVELCSSRTHMLTWDEETLMKEAQSINFNKAREIMKSNGVVQGGMYLVLLSVSAHITRQLGMAPGGEFRRAFREAEKIRNCIIQLGDRPIQITMKRAFASLNWWQTIKFAFHLLFKKEPISKEDVEKCKKRDFLETMVAEMAGEYPQLKNVFVNERDSFLTYSLQNAALLEMSPSGPVPSRVVGVVGIGHMPGIQEKWGKIQESDIRPILEIPPKPLSSKILACSVKITLVAFLLYGVNKFIPISLPNVSNVKSYFK